MNQNFQFDGAQHFRGFVPKFTILAHRYDFTSLGTVFIIFLVLNDVLIIPWLLNDGLIDLIGEISKTYILVYSVLLNGGPLAYVYLNRRSCSGLYEHQDWYLDEERFRVHWQGGEASFSWNDVDEIQWATYYIFIRTGRQLWVFPRSISEQSARLEKFLRALGKK